MSYHYFTCHWIANIDQQWYLPSLVDAALEIGCELGVLGTIQRTEEGYQFVVFMLSMPQKSILEKFINKAGSNINLTHWQSIKHSDIETYKSLTQLAQTHQSEALSSFYSGVSVIAGYNRELGRKLKREEARRRRWWYKLWRFVRRA